MDFIHELVDLTPYSALPPGTSTLDTAAPFYCHGLPSYEFIRRHGCNCAGLMNLLQARFHLPIPGVGENHKYAGGTYVWFEYLKQSGFLEAIDIEKSYAAGSLLVRKYRNDTDQGHLALLYTSGKLLEQQLLHCYTGPGITIDSLVATSHAWVEEGYYEYIVPSWFVPALPFTTLTIPAEIRDHTYLQFAIYSVESQMRCTDPQGRFFVSGDKKLSLESAQEIIDDYLYSCDISEYEYVVVETLFYLVTHRFNDVEFGLCEVRLWR